MANLWDDIAKTIREGVDTFVEKTEELTRIGRIKVDILNIKRNIDKNFSELGGRVYHLVVEEKKSSGKDVLADKEVKELIECVKILARELEDKKAELESIRAKEGVASDKPVAAPESKTKKTTARKTRTTKAGTAAKKN